MTMQALRESKYDQNGAAITGADGVKQVGLHKLHVTVGKSSILQVNHTCCW